MCLSSPSTHFQVRAVDNTIFTNLRVQMSIIHFRVVTVKSYIFSYDATNSCCSQKNAGLLGNQAPRCEAIADKEVCPSSNYFPFPNLVFSFVIGEDWWALKYLPALKLCESMASMSQKPGGNFGNCFLSLMMCFLHFLGGWIFIFFHWKQIWFGTA